MKQILFTLCSARSGTLFLSRVFRHNVRDCTSRHEPFFDWGNPTLLGPAIYDAYAGRVERLRTLLAKKRDYIEKLPGTVYFESSHAFLKSAYLVAVELFPSMQLIHLIRDPLKVAKSEAYREEWRRRIHAPFHYYRGEDGRRHFYWSLTGHEPIYRTFDLRRLSLFQRYLIQWVEIENRAVSFLNEHNLHRRCFTVQVPKDLNDQALFKWMFEFFGLKCREAEIILAGRKNENLWKRTEVAAEDEREAAEVLKQLPAVCLEIFHREPYASQPWNRRFLRLAHDEDSGGFPQVVKGIGRAGRKLAEGVRALNP